MGGFEGFGYHDEPIDATLAEVDTPSLVIDLDILERNLRRMALRMRKLGVRMRPHFKTHKSIPIAETQEELQAVGFTVATLPEARALMDYGRCDLTWAFPLILSKLPFLGHYLRNATLRLVVDSPQAVAALEETCRLEDAAGGSDYPVHVWLKVDCGYHRAGVDPEAPVAVDLARRIADSRRLTFDGILSHSGHAYRVRGCRSLARVAEEERRVMVDFAERLRAAGIEVPGVSIGSTPAMSAVENLDGITEVRPGNYVFYDYTQCAIGSCEIGDVALTVLSSVVSSQPGARHSVIDAGALALSLDRGPEWVEPCYGRIFGDYPAKELDPELQVASVSQEHGIVNRSLAVDSRLRILPNHSCLVVPGFDRYVVARGEKVVDYGRISNQRDI